MLLPNAYDYQSQAGWVSQAKVENWGMSVNMKVFKEIQPLLPDLPPSPPSASSSIPSESP